MDSVGAAEALAKAIANGPAPPGAYDNKGGFDSYSQHAQKDYALEVNGVVVGYQGHVPRARDKVGGCPLGGMAGVARSEGGFPAPEATVPTALPGMGTQTSQPTGENPLYVSTSHAVQFQTAAAAAGIAGGSPHKVKAAASGDGYIPRYAGHKAGASTKGIGGSIYGTKIGSF